MQTETQGIEWDKNHGPVVNGKVYPMWGQFVMQKEDWIGGDLVEHDSILYRDIDTKIKDIALEPNGESAMFCVIGEDFTFKTDVKYLGIGGTPSIEGGLRLCGPAGMEATIAKRRMH